MFRPRALHFARSTEASNSSLVTVVRAISERSAPNATPRKTPNRREGRWKTPPNDNGSGRRDGNARAKALDADPEGVALLRSVLDAGRKSCAAVQDKNPPKQRQSEERADTLDGQAGACEN